jgi:hypothetical protein
MNVVVEQCRDKIDGRRSSSSVREGTVVWRRGVLEVVGLAALAVEPAVAADSGGWGERASRGCAFRARAFCAIIAIRRCR